MYGTSLVKLATFPFSCNTKFDFNAWVLFHANPIWQALATYITGDRFNWLPLHWSTCVMSLTNIHSVFLSVCLRLTWLADWNATTGEAARALPDTRGYRRQLELGDDHWCVAQRFLSFWIFVIKQSCSKSVNNFVEHISKYKSCDEKLSHKKS